MFFVSRRMSGTHQLIMRSRKRVAFAPSVSWICLDYRRRNDGSAAVHLKLRRDLAVEQGQCLMPGGVILLTRCEPTDVASASAARRPDHMIGLRCLQSPGAKARRT